jgi:glycine cleavage system H protein
MQYGARSIGEGGLIMEFPRDRVYSEYHLWVKIEKDQALIGVTDHAREELGEVDYIELPELDDTITKNKPFGIIETSKAVTDLVAPISGVVIECNVALAESPETLTDDPYGDGWLIIVEPSDPDEFDELMKAADYERLVAGESDE